MYAHEMHERCTGVFSRGKHVHSNIEEEAQTSMIDVISEKTWFETNNQGDESHKDLELNDEQAF